MEEMQKNYNPSIRRHGFNLVELAIVLGVIGLVTGGIWAIAASVRENSRREQALEEVATVVTNVRSAYLGQVGMPTAGLSVITSQLISQGAIPTNMQRLPPAGCTNLNNLCADAPWGSNSANALFDQQGTFAVCDWGLGQKVCNPPCGACSPTQTFAVTLQGLPVGACIQLAEHLSSSLGPSGLDEVNINKCNIVENSGNCVAPTTAALPVSAGDANANCNLANAANIIRLVYRLRPPAN